MSSTAGGTALAWPLVVGALQAEVTHHLLPRSKAQTGLCGT
jgi:hypothetical protein